MTPPEAAAQIAARVIADARVQAAGLKSAHYPAPGHLPALPTMVLWWNAFEVAQFSDQNWVCTIRGVIFTAQDPPNVPDDIVAIDGLIVPIVDVFDANAHRDNFTLSYQTEGCQVTTGELSKRIPYDGQTYYGGEVFWRVQLSRFAD